MPETADLIRRYYAAFNAGDIPAMLALLTEDVVHDVNQGGRRRGRDAFRAFCEHMARCYEERLEDIVVLSAADSRHGAAEFMVHGRYVSDDPGLPKAEGQRYRLPAGTFFEVREGRLARVTTYYNLEDWKRQVGG